MGGGVLEGNPSREYQCLSKRRLSAARCFLGIKDVIPHEGPSGTYCFFNHSVSPCAITNCALSIGVSGSGGRKSFHSAQHISALSRL